GKSAMNVNHHTPVPTPTPFCALFGPQLPLLALDELDADQTTTVREHLASCEYCQAQLRQYEQVQAALLRHLGDSQTDSALTDTRVEATGMAEPPQFTAEDLPIFPQRMGRAAASQARRPDATSPVQPFSRPRGFSTRIPALVAMLLVAVLVGIIF